MFTCLKSTKKITFPFSVDSKMSWSENTGWWIGVIILLILILIVLIVICYVLYRAFSKVEKTVERALCEFYVFENRIMQGVEKVGERAKPLLERGMQGLEGLEGRLERGNILSPRPSGLLRSSIPRPTASGQLLV